MSETGNRCPRPDLLVALDEDVLPPSVAGEVQRHLDECSVCARLRQDLRDASLAQPTLGGLENVRAKVFGPARPRRLSMGHYSGLTIAAGALLCILYVTSRPRAAGPSPAIGQAPNQVRIEPPAAPSVPPRLPTYRLTLRPAPLRLPLTAMVLRGQDENTSEEYWKQLGVALQPYRAAQYSQAAARLAALAQAFPNAVEPPFYEGVARLLAGDPTGALPRLERARRIGGEALAADIRWYLAAALERAGSWMSAAPLLDELCRSENPYRQDACRAASPR